MTSAITSPTARAYDTAALGYDLLTRDYGYEPWAAAIEDLAVAHGLRGLRLLDAACGAGRSFMPFVERGYDVTACDGSPAMADLARERARGRVDVEVADLRELPVYGSFDLITCLGDVMNHLTSPHDLVLAFRGLRENLRDGGLLAFDVNGLAAYRDVPTVVVEVERALAIWRVDVAEPARAGLEAVIRMETLTERPDGLWERSSARWPHRHYPLADVRALLGRAGLRVVAIRGQRPGAVLDDDADETRFPKLLLLAARTDPPRKGGMS